MNRTHTHLPYICMIHGSSIYGSPENALLFPKRQYTSLFDCVATILSAQEPWKMKYLITLSLRIRLEAYLPLSNVISPRPKFRYVRCRPDFWVFVRIRLFCQCLVCVLASLSWYCSLHFSSPFRILYCVFLSSSSAGARLGIVFFFVLLSTFSTLLLLLFTCA